MARPETESIHFKTSDGLTLEGELAVPSAVKAAALLTHPHPMHGGSMRSIIPSALFEHLPQDEVACLRFNFRGIGASEGQFDDGRGERLDIVAALDVLHPIVEGLPLLLAGWSFGADTALSVTDSRVSAWMAVAPPLRDEKLGGMAAASDHRRKLLVVPQHDEFCNPEQAATKTQSWMNTQLEVVKGADHYLVGRTDAVVKQAQNYLSEL